jgi:hypothetical protein
LDVLKQRRQTYDAVDCFRDACLFAFLCINTQSAGTGAHEPALAGVSRSADYSAAPLS